MSNDIRDIIERLAILEGRITPTTVKHGLNPQQKEVPQLPALFKPKTQKILGGNPNAKNPMSGYMVGDSVDHDEEADKELFDAVVMAKDLAIHDPSERFANPDAEADVNVAAKWKEVNRSGGAGTPGWAAGYPKTDNKNIDVRSTSSTTTSNTSPTEKFMGPADVVDVDAKEVKEALAKMLAHAGVKEGNIPDRIPSTLDVINYRDYVSQMKSQFGQDWTPDPEPMKPYDTKNLGPTQYSQPPVEEDEEADKEVVEEAQANEEKLLDKVKKSLLDYLGSIEDKYQDADIKEKKKDDRDLGKKSKDKDLVTKEKEVVEDPTQEDPVTQASTIPIENPTYAESAPVKTITMEDGRICEIHGNEHTGFEIRHGNRSLKSRFKNIDEAAMALEMYCAKVKQQDQSADYIEEA